MSDEKTVFERLLICYELALELAEMKRKHEDESPEYLDGFQRGLLQLFQSAKDAVGFKPQIDPATEEEQERYFDSRWNNKPYGILRYRGQEVPIYTDDYGQQDYMIFRGETVGGGAYNFFSDVEFCNYIDKILDNDIAKVRNLAKN